MNRFKIKSSDVDLTKKFLKNNSLPAPNWAKKFKDDLKVNEGKLYYKNGLVIASEDIDDYLRTRLYDKNDLQMGRDACFYQLQKENIVGISRRKIMSFFKSQRTLGENRSATKQSRTKSGIKIKNHTLEFDLVFVKKGDVVDCNPRFETRLEDERDWG